MNRTIIANGNTQIEEYPQTCYKIGDAVELPMNCWGSVVKRFIVVVAEEFTDWTGATMIRHELAAV